MTAEADCGYQDVCGSRMFREKDASLRTSPSPIWSHELHQFSLKAFVINHRLLLRSQLKIFQFYIYVHCGKILCIKTLSHPFLVCHV